MKLIVDLSSVLKTCLYAGKDLEAYDVLDEDGKTVTVNTAAYGYENTINSIVATLKELDAVPSDLVLVREGYNSKARRLMLDRQYKATRGTKVPAMYEEFNNLLEKVISALSKVGAITVQQDGVEADDVIAWIARESEDDLCIVSNDGDLAALIGTNAYGSKIIMRRMAGILRDNPYGNFSPVNITIYKATVGDSSDNIKGVPGFGAKAFEKLLAQFGDDGLTELRRLAEAGNLSELYAQAEEDPLIKKLVHGELEFLKSYQVAKLHPEWVNTLQQPLQWKPGLVTGTTGDERLRRWESKTRLVTAGNYADACRFLKAKLQESPCFALDLETSTPDESDDWLSVRKRKGAKSDGVDVISSVITGGSITFGQNGQFSYYITVNHRDSDNVTLKQFGDLIRILDPSKITVAHNAAGFELPVLFNHFGVDWKGNGWRGMFPNMVDSRIAASFWDENQMSHSLKHLSKLLLAYEQETYEQVTTVEGVPGTLSGGRLLGEFRVAPKELEPVGDLVGASVEEYSTELLTVERRQYKMCEIPAEKVLSYGCDDVITSMALWKFFKLFMETEHTFEAFMKLEQKPMYLQALAYCQGVTLDMVRLADLTAADEKLEGTLQNTLDKYLVSCGWDGTVLPVYDDISAANIKQVVQMLGATLDTMVRTPRKLVPLIAALDVPGCTTLAGIVDHMDVAAFNAFVRQHWTAKPLLNPGSPIQMQRLLYGTLALPVRLRNKPTEAMRAKGQREGTPRTDEDTIKMAIQAGDVTKPEDVVMLNALVGLKSIATRRGLYWDAYPKALHWRTGKIHPELRQSATNTRRYAGSNPNLQQMDSNPDGVRSVILPHHKDAVVVSLDESAQEVRQLADYARDDNLLTCYLGNSDQLRDVHSIVACKIADCTYEEFRRRLKQGTDAERVEANAQRQKAKITLFASIYGAAAPKIAEGLGIHTEEAQGYIDAIYAQFPGVATWKQVSEAMATDFGRVPIHGGTVRHLGALITSDDRFAASKALRQAGNARIQSAGGNQIKTVMSDIWDSDLIEKYDYRWYFSCHDETIHSIGRGDVVEVVKILHAFMCKQFLEVVPSASSIGIGKNFGQLNELGEVFDADAVRHAVDEIFA